MFVFVDLWLLAAGRFSSFVRCVVLLLCLVDPVKHCDYLAGEEGAGCFAILWFVACVLYIMIFISWFYIMFCEPLCEPIFCVFLY